MHPLDLIKNVSCLGRLVIGDENRSCKGSIHVSSANARHAFLWSIKGCQVVLCRLLLLAEAAGWSLITQPHALLTSASRLQWAHKLRRGNKARTDRTGCGGVGKNEIVSVKGVDLVGILESFDGLSSTQRCICGLYVDVYGK